MKNYEIRKLLNKIKNIEDKETLYLINKLIRERNYLMDIAYKDSLTGLNNRRSLNSIDKYSAVVMCDIDDYKQVNDLYGHIAGDSIIKIISDIIKTNIRKKDYACRYGGDEFLIAFVDGTEDYVYEQVDKIRKQAESSVILPDEDSITMSFGIVINRGKDLVELIEQADAALYESKEKGKNQITLYKSKKKKINATLKKKSS